MNWQNWRCVGAMHKWNLRRGNIDRGNASRALLTDTSPDDVPIIFSNDGFHANLQREPTTEGLRRIIDAVAVNCRERYTVPYRYRIRLTNTSSRQISLAHPAAQHRACHFYQAYGHLIPYFCRHDDVSMRRPTKIGSAYFYAGRLAERKKYKGAAIDLLLDDQVVRNPGSFFAYEKYDRFYKFFNSTEFVELEKTFSVMRLSDISKCFSSIYSHTMAWAIKDVQHGKENTSAVSFANDFDALMQFSNYNETNGIPVGAEISRLFAEIILQSVDVDLLRRANQYGLAQGRDFEIRRYIDDYAIFANKVEVLDSLQRGLSEALQVFNLHLNDSKTSTVCRPLQTRRSQIIADATVGLNRFRDQVSKLDPVVQATMPGKVRKPESLTRTFVNDMKVACVNASAGYEDVSAYIIGSISATIENLVGSYKVARRSKDFSSEAYVGAFEALLRSLYYFFTVHATVSSSYQVAKATIISIRFFRDRLTEFSDVIHEVVRQLIQSLIQNPALQNLAMSAYVPIELLNVILASSELPIQYRINIFDIHRRILEDDQVDYFSIVTLLFYYNDSDVAVRDEIEEKLLEEFLPKVRPTQNSHDAHFMLDLIACPYLTRDFRKSDSLIQWAGDICWWLLLIRRSCRDRRESMVCELEAN
ncbi:antiviral reverse transcriptase Drt3b [Bradyrhizobium sp. NAS96.2]|uniref:antiviral reverse transcriptase Drt3b n=1 Tax=Bradyrhizobium sp. NAS96.2 TaxID=1680160 RepID=UPI0009FB1997|nr:antiviral reverse transcriptase Drt3b [Bradyrhizobium sp. NAS96.2]